jgi:hypothetical protein
LNHQFYLFCAPHHRQELPENVWLARLGQAQDLRQILIFRRLSLKQPAPALPNVARLAMRYGGPPRRFTLLNVIYRKRPHHQPGPPK